MAARLQHNEHGVPFGFGNLSIAEIREAALKIGFPDIITNTIFDAFDSHKPKILFVKYHYLLFYTTIDKKRCIFDSLGKAHAADLLADHAPIYLSILNYINEPAYQSVNSDTCGLFALFALFVFSTHNSKFMNCRHFIETLNEYLTPYDFASNEFSMVQFACQKEIGEEYRRSDKKYSKFQKLLKLIEEN
jgi:hypothetical protein